MSGNEKIYQVESPDGKHRFVKIDMKAPMNKYIKQVSELFGAGDRIICIWKIKSPSGN